MPQYKPKYKPASPQVEESVADAPEGAGPIQITGSERRERQSQIDKWRDHFASQPKVRVRLQEDARVQVNGYTFEIKGKVSVEVPELVAEILEQAGKI